MSLEKLNPSLINEVQALEKEGRAKAPERVITGYVPPSGAGGPRYTLRGASGEFLRMNSNSYLSLSNHPALLEAADAAATRFGAGPGGVLVIFDGIFSMRGDNAPVAETVRLTGRYESRYRDGVVTIMDDSHGIGAYGETGRGTEEFCGARVDILVGTFGKAFGVNGGFIAGSPELVEAVRQKADTYIYTNPLGAADAAAAIAGVAIADGADGRERLANLKARTK